MITDIGICNCSSVQNDLQSKCQKKKKNYFRYNVKYVFRYTIVFSNKNKYNHLHKICEEYELSKCDD